MLYEHRHVLSLADVCKITNPYFLKLNFNIRVIIVELGHSSVQFS